MGALLPIEAANEIRDYEEVQFRQMQIRARDLRVGYGDSFSLVAPQLDLVGNTIAIIGHNGAGKSTLIKSILGLLPSSYGSLSITDLSEKEKTILRPDKHMAFCPETGSVFADISVESYIRLWCRIKHGDPNYYRRGGSRYIELLSIAPLLSKLGRELSKGQRRRVQTAIGFLITPRLFLFDEPFDGLDVQKTSELADIVASHKPSMTFIISSHRMDVVERVADRLIVLDQGRLASVGTVPSVCLDLAKQGISIARIEHPDQLCSRLRNDYPLALVNRVADTVTVVGAEFDSMKLQTVLRRYGYSNAQFSNITPSLTDAMNYHLRKVEYARKLDDRGRKS